MKRILFLSIALILTISLNAQQTVIFKDPRDGKTYQTVKIGNQVWMAENLAYKPSSGNYWAYDDNQSNVAKFGYIYNWYTAKNACPTGWHLPSNTEWKRPTDFVGNHNSSKLRAKSGWSSDSNGTDDYGFAALPGGARNNEGPFFNQGYGAYWWSSTESSSSNACHLEMLCNNDLFISNLDYFEKEWGFSVRCVKD